MARNEIVSEFFSRGHLLTEEAIKLLEEQGTAVFLAKRLPLVVDSHDLKQPYRIIKNIKSTKSEITKEDFVKFYNSKYEKMREIITSRLQKDFVSLNKVDSTRSEIHVIGIVKEIKEKDGKKIVDLEDPTGSIPVIFDEIEDLELDDVVAVRAVAGGKVLFGKKILYPDIPLRQPTTGEGRGCFVSDLRLDEASTADAERFFHWFSQQDVEYLFVAGTLGNKELFEKYVERYCYVKTVFIIAGGDMPQPADTFSSSRIVALSNPALVEVGGVKILMLQKADTKILMKRHMGKSRIVTDEDYLVIEDVPDVVVSGHSSDPYVTNYKSVTLVNSGSLLGDFRPIIVDFATRDVDKVNLKVI